MLNTREVALNLADDFRYLREVVAKPDVTSAEVRRMSAVVRRMLIEGDLKRVAAPRLRRKMHLTTVDVNPFITANDPRSLELASLGAGGLLGISADAVFFSIDETLLSHPLAEPGKILLKQRWGPERLSPVLVNLDGFLTQRTFCFRGEWMRRLEIVKYVANVAGGAHSGALAEPQEKSLAEARKVAAIQVNFGNPTLVVSARIWDSENGIDVERSGIDLVLLQLLAAAKFIVASPDMTELEAIIEKKG